MTILTCFNTFLLLVVRLFALNHSLETTRTSVHGKDKINIYLYNNFDWNGF